MFSSIPRIVNSYHRTQNTNTIPRSRRRLRRALSRDRRRSHDDRRRPDADVSRPVILVIARSHSASSFARSATALKLTTIDNNGTLLIAIALVFSKTVAGESEFYRPRCEFVAEKLLVNSVLVVYVIGWLIVSKCALVLQKLQCLLVF